MREIITSCVLKTSIFHISIECYVGTMLIMIYSLLTFNATIKCILLGYMQSITYEIILSCMCMLTEESSKES